MKEQDKVDWQGNTLPENEPLDSLINIWAIDPGLSDNDETWIRSYFDAMDYVQELTQELMDGGDENDLLEFGVQVNVKLKRIRLQDYLEVVEEE